MEKEQAGYKISLCYNRVLEDTIYSLSVLEREFVARTEENEFKLHIPRDDDLKIDDIVGQPIKICLLDNLAIAVRISSGIDLLVIDHIG